MGQAEGLRLVMTDSCRRYVTERGGDRPPAGALEYPPGQDVWGGVPGGSVAGQDSVAGRESGMEARECERCIAGCYCEVRSRGQSSTHMVRRR